MTRARSPYLLRRQSGFYVRIRVPPDLVERVGKVEVRRALGPMPFHNARAVAARVGSRLKDCFEMLRNADSLSPKEVENCIRDCFAILKEPMDRPYVPTSDDPWYEFDEQRALATEHLTDKLTELDHRNFGPGTRALAHSLTERCGINLEGASPQRLQSILEGVARAVVETDRVFLKRLEDGVTEYVPHDTLFSGPPRSKQEGIGLTVSELCEAYLAAHTSAWTPKTLRTHRPKLQLLIDYLGGDRPAETITRLDLIEFPEELLRLRVNHGGSVGQTFASRQTANEDHRIMPSTAAGILARTTAMFRWGYTKGYISSDPAAGLGIVGPKKKKGQRNRRSFSAAELETLFSSPLFAGCKSAARRFEPGDAHVRDEQFWIPVLAYYTGARLGELVQLHFADCHLDGPHPYISINEEGPEMVGDPDYKHVKSDAGVRNVPLHPDLMTLGFADWVKRQKKRAGGRKRLHFGVKYGADNQASTVFSKRFGRLLDRVGLTDPTLVFHSFRHTAQDYFRANKTPQYITDQIIGHQGQTAAAAYGVGVGIDVAAEVVAGLTLPVSVPMLISEASTKR